MIQMPEGYSKPVGLFCVECEGLDKDEKQYERS